MTMRKIIIAIDGYSSCGKSSFAKAIAAKLGYIFIDTGAMYRGVTLWAIRHGMVDGPRVDEARLVRLQRGAQGRRPDPMRRERRGADTYHRGERRRKPCERHTGRESPYGGHAAGDGTGQRRGDGRTRHRHHRIPRCRTQDIHDGECRRTRRKTLQGAGSQRRECHSGRGAA